MTEIATNRSWLVSNRLNNRETARQTANDPGVLLYYQTQLEAELADVRKQLAELTSAGSRSS